MTSLRTRLAVIWVLSLVASIAVGLLLVQLTRQSGAVLRERAEAELGHACERIAERYAYYAAGWSGPSADEDAAGLQRDLDAVVAVALSASRGVSGGILRDPESVTPSTPASRVAAAALAQGASSVEDSTAGSLTTLTLACPLGGPIADLAAWVETDVQAAPGTEQLRIGLGVLLALMLGLSGGLTWLVSSWARQVRRMEAALAAHDQRGLPLLAPTGEAELDRIARALNSAGARIAAAQEEAASASARAAAAERLAALGRVAAGVAHEIRNPIAAMRLRAEGALAIDPARESERAATRGRAALGAILGQVDRLDRLSGELLAMTQGREPVPEIVSLPGFLAACAADWPHDKVRVEAPDITARFDPAMIRRALDNLVQNALRHTPADGVVWLRATAEAGMLRISVQDSGPGVPDALRTTLFEPFVTGRADGTGLGLPIAREMVHAHGGRLELASANGAASGGAVFTLELPQ